MLKRQIPQQSAQSPLIGLRDTRFSNDRFARLGIELMRLSDLKRRTDTGLRARPERVEFFMLWLTTQGASSHAIDFVDFAVGAGSLVFARPAQVQQWRVETPMEGWILLVEPAALLPSLNNQVSPELLLSMMQEWPAVVQLDAQFSEDLTALVDYLERDFANYNESELDNALIQNAVLGLLFRLAKWHSAQPGVIAARNAPAQVFQLFSKALEVRFRQQWPVSQYAKYLGYSESTVNRACEAATGRSAKVLIDRRLALEGARLLIHTDLSIVELSHQLGFSESTNFVRFFSRVMGATPARFRREKLG